ncbi:MAG TPA: hypothetical protein VMU45_06160 [Candidatus Eisenbacteria bacterium]|nr:hypothetical protein [Candidatus Eisenbacteria bacterium]
MKTRTVLFVSVFTLIASLAAVAQPTPTTLAALEFQKPKNGMVKQYEDGRKQKAAWHKQQNDPQALYVWETLTGDDTGTYIVGRLNQHWADFDKPPIPDQADIDEYNKVISSYVEALTARYYALLPKVSNPGQSTPTDKFAEIVTFQVRYGKGSEFQSAIARVTEAAQKTKWPVDYIWYKLASGGNTGTFVLVLPHKTWADFEDKPDTKPFRDMLKDAFGGAQADSIIDWINESVESESAQIIQFRPDLSYLPAK